MSGREGRLPYVYVYVCDGWGLIHHQATYLGHDGRGEAGLGWLKIRYVTWLHGYKDPLHGLVDPDSYWLRDRDSSQL